MKQVVLSDAVVEPIMPGDLNWIYRYISITLMTRNLWVWKDVRLEVREWASEKKEDGGQVYVQCCTLTSSLTGLQPHSYLGHGILCT